MIELTLDNIVKFLKNKDFKADIQTETNQVFFIYKDDRREFPLFIRMYEEGDLLQILSFFPIQLDKKMFDQIARLLHLFNKELDTPGFGMDEIGGVAFFRMMVPTNEKKIEEKELEERINGTMAALKTFSPTVEAVAAGLTTVDDLIKKAQDAVKKIKP